jgi:hypothetical protein
VVVDGRHQCEISCGLVEGATSSERLVLMRLQERVRRFMDMDVKVVGGIIRVQLWQCPDCLVTNLDQCRVLTVAVELNRTGVDLGITYFGVQSQGTSNFNAVFGYKPLMLGTSKIDDLLLLFSSI